MESSSNQPFSEKAETAPGEGEPATAAFSGGSDKPPGEAAGAVELSLTYSQTPTQSSLGERGSPASAPVQFFISPENQ